MNGFLDNVSLRYFEMQSRAIAKQLLKWVCFDESNCVSMCLKKVLHKNHVRNA